MSDFSMLAASSTHASPVLKHAGVMPSTLKRYTLHGKCWTRHGTSLRLSSWKRLLTIITAKRRLYTLQTAG